MAGEAGKRKKTKRAASQLESLTLTDLEQVKVLADPLRLRILEVFCDGSNTTKQVADQIGEKPTKLYHHVEALARVGLIRLVKTRQNRGTLEKYYEAVARSFRADSRLFSASPDRDESLQSVLTSLLDSTAADLGRSMSSEAGKSRIDEEAIVTRLKVRASPRQIARLRKGLKKWLEQVEAADEDKGEIEYGVTVVFYPMLGS